MATILITGANRGIGLALVECFAARGDRVIATARDPSTVEGLAAVVSRFPDLVEVHALEVTDPVSIAALAARLDDRPLDVLINNAGVIGPQRQSSLDMDFAGWLDTFRVNTLAPLAVAQALLPALRRGDHAKILTVSTAMGSMAAKGSDRVAYRSSKAAVNKVMQCLATDLRGEGIAVAVCHPGWVKTEMGGDGAELTPEMSATGITRIVDRMSIGHSPAFHVWDGTTMQW
ncbi:SDR family oxidoreductase [Siculibacillus lacustris]|uniref:SDR family oxidoreductase n=1 Tax=Siculibacillus lacustris TaxID=1549641 RepID=A0A4Q9VSB2_9HYPH|nr:SDR family oxidoreductase [Siculibacillus lacustris]TBW38725.1 SDR family oxidoreductase [Siculibacillus lacustris]